MHFSIRTEEKTGSSLSAIFFLIERFYPPSLLAFSRLVGLKGLNDYKLKKGFRQVFGTTVFGYLNQQRMQKARQLLAQQQTIAAVAIAVDQAITTNPTDFDTSSGEARQSDGAFTPRVGLVYKPVENVSLYGSYSQVFGPSQAETTTVDGDLLDFESGEGFEFGVKTELLGGKLAAGINYFNITRRNIATDDPDNPFFFIATGEQRSQGVEMDISGEIILPGWNVLASYAYIGAEIAKDSK